jgi:hypothetical protein
VPAESDQNALFVSVDFDAEMDSKKAESVLKTEVMLCLEKRKLENSDQIGFSYLAARFETSSLNNRSLYMLVAIMDTRPIKPAM